MAAEACFTCPATLVMTFTDPFGCSNSPYLRKKDEEEGEGNEGGRKPGVLVCSTVHITQYTVHSTQHTAHSTHYILE